MGIDAQYYLRFTSNQAATAALEAISTQDEYFPGTFIITEHDVEMLFAILTSADSSVVQVASMNRYLDSDIILDATPGSTDLSEIEQHRALGILSDLELLRSFPELDGVAIRYASDHHDAGHYGVVVDDNLLSGLWNITSTLEI